MLVILKKVTKYYTFKKSLTEKVEVYLPKFKNENRYILN